MKRPTLKAKAIAVDLKKNKMIVGGLALLAGLMAMTLFSSNAQAKDAKFPFQLTTQKLSN